MTTATQEAATAARHARRAAEAAADATTSAARAANGAGYREVLASQEAGLGLWDRVKAAPRALKGWITATLKTFKLDKAAGVVGEGARWAWDRLQGVLGLVKGFGYSNILGAIITTPLRHTAVEAIATAAHVVTTPLRWGWAGVSWLLSKFEFTNKLVVTLENRGHKALAAVAGQIDQGLTWLDKHDGHGAMRWLRWYFQAKLVRHAVALAFPAVPGWAVYAASLMVPVYGDYAPEEEAAIGRAKEHLAKNPAQTRAEALVHGAEAVSKAAEAAATAVSEPELLATTRPPRKPGDPYMRTEIAVMTDTDRKAKFGSASFEAVSFVDEKGVRRFRLGDSEQLLLLDDLPETVAFVGTRPGGLPLLQDQEAFLAEEQRKADLETEVRLAQATTGGKPPTLPRAARRASNGRGKAASARS